MAHTTSTGPQVPAPPVRAADERFLAPALHGFIDGTGLWNPGALARIECTGRFLAGERTSQDVAEAVEVAGEGSWTRFIGRIGALALRAAAPSTRPERREVLLALLEIWSRSPFADPTARLRVGVAKTGRAATRNASGAAVTVTWPRDGRCRFLDIRTGAEPPPSLGPVDEVGEPPRGWGNAEQLRRLLTLVRERGPMPWDPDAVRLLAGETGLSRGAAALLLAGNPGTGSYYTPFLDTGERRILGLKVAEADDARQETAGLTTSQRLELYADVLPEDPDELWEPGGARALAAGIAREWVVRHGRRTAVPERTLATVVGFRPTRISAAGLCAALAGPASEPLLIEDTEAWISEGEWGCWLDSADGRRRWFEELLHSIADHLHRVYAELPAGDPVREGAPEAVRLLRERLANPPLLLNGPSWPAAGGIEPLRGVLGGRPYSGPAPLGCDSLDDGLTVVTATPPGRRGEPGSPRSFFRPALLADDERSERLKGRVSPYDGRTVAAVMWLRGAACDRMLERITSGALPQGTYETDPRRCVPGLVHEVAGRLGGDEDAAVLYLQLLALPTAPDREIRRWNGWTAPWHKAAADTLVTRGLVVQGRRPRAGRGVFLPGAWADGGKFFPSMETWKARLHDARVIGGKIYGVSLPSRTLPELFTAAWRRVEEGDGPR